MMNNLKFVCETDCELDVEELAKCFEGVVESDTPLAFEFIKVTAEEIQKLNKDNRNIDKVTDVLSFPSMDDIFQKKIIKKEHPFDLDDDGNVFLGSVVICNDKVVEQAKEFNHSERRELYYLTVHSLLHLLGYDHIQEDDKRTMREKEESILNKMNVTRDN